MLVDALHTALGGMTSASTQAAAAAEVIANPEPSPDNRTKAPRVAYLPLPGDPMSAMATLIEASLSFKANAAVFRTATEMVEALYKSTEA